MSEQLFYKDNQPSFKNFYLNKWSRIHGSTTYISDGLWTPMKSIVLFTVLESCNGEFSRRINSFDIQNLSRILTIVRVSALLQHAPHQTTTVSAPLSSDYLLCIGLRQGDLLCRTCFQNVPWIHFYCKVGRVYSKEWIKHIHTYFPGMTQMIQEFSTETGSNIS